MSFKPVNKLMTFAVAGIMWFCGVGAAYIHPDSQVPLQQKLESYQIEMMKSGPDNDRRIFIYTDIAKAYLFEKQYDQALLYLLKAKNLGASTGSKSTSYYSPFAKLFAELGAYGSAIEYEKKLIHTSGDKLTRYYSAASTGILYARIGANDSSLHYYNLQLSIAQQMDDYIALASAHNNIGIYFLNNSRSLEAKKEFLKAQQIMESNKSSVSLNFELEKADFYYGVIENLGRCYYKLGDYASAVRCLESANYYRKNYRYDANKLCLLQSYLALGEKSKAFNLVKSENYRGRMLSQDEQKILQNMLFEYALYNGDLQTIRRVTETIQLLDRKEKAQKSILSNRMSQILSKYLLEETKSNIRREREEKKLVMKKLRVEKDRQNTYLMTSVVSLILLLVGFMVFRQFFLNKRRSMDLRNEELELQSRIQEHTIKMQEVNISEYAFDFTKNRDYETAMLKKLQKISQSETGQLDNEIRSLVAELKQKLLLDRRTATLVADSEKVLGIFRSKLTAIHSGLSKSDIQLCYLLKLELDNKEIAALKSVTTDSIKIFKNRLKNKLGLSAKDSLAEYIRNL